MISPLWQIVVKLLLVLILPVLISSDDCALLPSAHSLSKLLSPGAGRLGVHMDAERRGYSSPPMLTAT